MNKINRNLFKLDAAGACGVLMPTEVMKKVTKLQNKYIDDLKTLMNEYKDTLISYSWTMGWDQAKGGEAVYAYFIDKSTTVDSRIKNFNITNPIKVECFDSDDYDVVHAWCVEKYNAIGEKE